MKSIAEQCDHHPPQRGDRQRGGECAKEVCRDPFFSQQPEVDQHRDRNDAEHQPVGGLAHFLRRPELRDVAVVHPGPGGAGADEQDQVDGGPGRLAQAGFGVGHERGGFGFDGRTWIVTRRLAGPTCTGARPRRGSRWQGL